MGARTMFVTGMLICLLAAALMLLDVVGVAWGAAIGMVGVGVASTSGARRRTGA